MAQTFDPTGWSAALFGLFALFAAIGALRQPGIWRAMVDEISRSPALQILSGLLELFLGAVVYLVNPWAPADVLSCVMKALGGLMVLEAQVVTGFSDIYFHFWLRNLASAYRIWALLTLLVGAVLAIAGFMRFA